MRLLVSTSQRETTTLRSQLTSAQQDASSLRTQLASAQNQMTALNRIVALEEQQQVATNKTVNGAAGASVPVVSFEAKYAGFVVTKATTSTSNGYANISYMYKGSPFNLRQTVGASGSAWAPVLPGTVTISFGNTNSFNGATGTFDVTYFY